MALEDQLGQLKEFLRTEFEKADEKHEAELKNLKEQFQLQSRESSAVEDVTFKVESYKRQFLFNRKVINILNGEDSAEAIEKAKEELRNRNTILATADSDRRVWTFVDQREKIELTGGDSSFAKEFQTWSAAQTKKDDAEKKARRAQYQTNARYEPFPREFPGYTYRESPRPYFRPTRGFFGKSTSSRIAADSCRKCGMRGHWQADCPLNKEQ